MNERLLRLKKRLQQHYLIETEKEWEFLAPILKDFVWRDMGFEELYDLVSDVLRRFNQIRDDINILFMKIENSA